MSTKYKIGFIGLGLMGNPMAKNILKGGFPLTVYNRSPEKTKELKKLGASIAHSPADLAKDVDVVITMVTAPRDVRQVLLGNDGVAETLKKGGVVIDMSTIGPTSAREIAEDLKFAGIDFLDAPVTGSTNRAETGELTILVGGDKKIYEKVLPILKCMGKDIFYLGKTGSGQAVKLSNNLMGAVTVAALAEAMLLADQLGIKRSEIERALSNAPLISTNMKMKMPLMIKNKFPVAFSVANMRKDLKLALNEGGKEKGLSLLKTTDKLLKKAMDKGMGGDDYSSLIKVMEEKS